MTTKDLIAALQHPPRPLRLMEVCGTHTSAIVKGGIRTLISPDIQLVSGPGCPVCVTPTHVIDGLVDYAMTPGHTVFSFGDLFRVRGSGLSLGDCKAQGGSVELMYSPFDVIPHAKQNPNQTFVIGAVGFETTIPIYAALLEQLEQQNIKNIKLYTALKTMPAILDYVCATQMIDGFLCPGHVSVIIGSGAYEQLCAKHQMPFVVAGFTEAHILLAVYEMMLQYQSGAFSVKNRYPSVVSRDGQPAALTLIERYFEPTSSLWRGIGEIAQSGYGLRKEYARYCANKDVPEIGEARSPCQCADVMLGRIAPPQCPLYHKACTPQNPVGACMVSSEGACRIWSEGG